MSQYLSEAFKKLDTLNEDTFTISDNGLEDFVKFKDEDEFEDIVDVIDPEATTVDELQDSYVGKVILDCCVCHSKIYKDVEDVIIKDDIANEGEECPFCYTPDGYKVIGQVAVFNEEDTKEETTEDSEEVTLEEGLFDKKSKGTKEIKASELKKGDILVGRFGDDTRQDKVVSVTDDGESVEVRYKNGGGFMPKDEIVKIRESLKETDDLDIEEGLFSKKNKGNIKEIKASELKKGDIVVGRFGDDNRQDKVVSVADDGESVEVRYKNGGGFIPNDEVVKIRESIKRADESDMEEGLFGKKDKGTKEVKATELKKGNTLLLVGSEDKVTGVTDEGGSHISVSLKHGTVAIPRNHIVTIRESLNNVNVETDKDVINVSTDEEGKVTVSTEPKKDTVDSEETIAPLDPETQSEISDNVADGEEIEIDMDEFDEESFDELGEGYLKKVYENVNSFKTSNVSFIKNKLILEGVIKFNSGKAKKTNFIFESREATKTGKVRFIGENKEIARGKKSFTVTGKMEGSKFLSESLNYNYGVKGANGKSQRLYGTVRTKKAGK